jgi:threonine/homoserine/homoserine lactone efflux protein
MDWSAFPRGVLIGVSVAAPVGPMALLCIRRTLAGGAGAGFVSGVGVATADAFYGAVAAFGLTSISSLLLDYDDAVRFVGGLFLCYLGGTTLRSAAGSIAAGSESQRLGAVGAFLSTLGLTLTNPATILSFAAIFSGFGFVSEDAGMGSAAALVAGVFSGSTLWWLVLSSGTDRFRGWLTSQRLTWINRACGTAILGFGLMALFSTIR